MATEGWAGVEGYDAARAKMASLVGEQRPSVPAMLVEAEQGLEKAHELIGNLESRLDAILGPERTATMADGTGRDTPPPPVAPLTRRMIELNESIRRLSANINAISGRLEL